MSEVEKLTLQLFRYVITQFNFYFLAVETTLLYVAYLFFLKGHLLVRVLLYQMALATAISKMTLSWVGNASLWEDALIRWPWRSLFPRWPSHGWRIYPFFFFFFFPFGGEMDFGSYIQAWDRALLIHKELTICYRRRNIFCGGEF